MPARVRKEKTKKNERGSIKKAGRVLIFFTHFPPETPFLKAAGRCPSSLSLSLLSPTADTHSVFAVTSIHRTLNLTSLPYKPFHIFILLLGVFYASFWPYILQQEQKKKVSCLSRWMRLAETHWSKIHPPVTRFKQASSNHFAHPICEACLRECDVSCL